MMTTDHNSTASWRSGTDAWWMVDSGRALMLQQRAHTGD